MFFVEGPTGVEVHTPQDCQQTSGKTVSPFNFKNLLVNPLVVLVQIEPAVNCSSTVQPSNVNLYSTESSARGIVIS
jgi:hypothetical protein